MSEVKNVIDELFSKSNDDKFFKLLSNITYAKDETKKLWADIYRNAVEDRSNAHILFLDLYKIVLNDDEKHQIHDKALALYLERMNKANEQLLKLAEMINDAVNDDETLDANDVYDSFGNVERIK